MTLCRTCPHKDGCCGCTLEECIYSRTSQGEKETAADAEKGLEK